MGCSTLKFGVMVVHTKKPKGAYKKDYIDFINSDDQSKPKQNALY